MGLSSAVILGHYRACGDCGPQWAGFKNDLQELRSVPSTGESEHLPLPPSSQWEHPLLPKAKRDLPLEFQAVPGNSRLRAVVGIG